MTVVFKNAVSSTPHVNLGTTLFIKKHSVQPLPDLDNSNNNDQQNDLNNQNNFNNDKDFNSQNNLNQNDNNLNQNNPQNPNGDEDDEQDDNADEDEDEDYEEDDEEEEEESKKTTKKEVDPWVKVQEIQECLKKNGENSENALYTRERRLMAHMGLKGNFIIILL